MDALEMALLFDYYGGLLTPKQRECFDMRYNQDLSLGEIGQLLGVSRSMKFRRNVQSILDAAQKLSVHPDETVTALAQQILAATRDLEE